MAKRAGILTIAILTTFVSFIYSPSAYAACVPTVEVCADVTWANGGGSSSARGTVTGRGNTVSTDTNINPTAQNFYTISCVFVPQGWRCAEVMTYRGVRILSPSSTGGQCLWLHTDGSLPETCGLPI